MQRPDLSLVPSSELGFPLPEIHDAYVFDESCPASRGVAGKLSMGIGGINACVLSRPW